MTAVRVETGLAACRALWERFSPAEDAWDDWDLMFAFHDPDKHRLNFLVHEADGGAADGLLPLVYDSIESRYTLFGGSYPDGRAPWLLYRDFPDVFDALPEPTVLFDIRQDWVDGLLQVYPHYAAFFKEPESRYFLAPADFDFDFERHLAGLPADRRQRFQYDLRQIGKRNPVLRWSGEDESTRFIELVNRNFGSASDYADADNARELHRVIDQLRQSGRLKTLTIEVDGHCEAVSLSLLYRNRMVALYAASNNDINNLGKLLNVEAIREACRLRVDEISFMTGMQWKARWNMRAEACITFRKPQSAA